MASRTGAVDVVLEVGAKRVFARAVDWPGWCRPGRTEEAAVEALTTYLDRYASVAAAAGLRVPAEPTVTVVERVHGDATTDFGAPSAMSRPDFRPVGAADARRIATVVDASWQALDAIASGAPAELRKGPRGGGRDRDKMLAHVASAEAAYARKLGLRLREPAPGARASWLANRAVLLELLGRPSDGERLVEPKGWPQRYAAARIAWHVLDHAWEMQDRST